MAKILVVDGDVALTETVTELLSLEKHEVEVVNTGLLGWERVQSQAYDILLLDWDLPDLNGINILRRFRDAGGKTPVIMMTGRLSASDKGLGLDCGADDYITKPLDSAELTARIRAVLRRTQAQRPVNKALGTGNQEVLKRANLNGSSLAARYEFLEVIGEGGTGLVFKARQPMMDRLVAIKMLHSGQVNEEISQRFNLEAKALSRLDHPNIVCIYDFGSTESNELFMVMEFVSGTSLHDLLVQAGALPLPFALELAVQLCDGFAHAHSRGTLHRDISPRNVLLKETDGDRPTVKIVDFGLAKLRSVGLLTASPALTQFGQVFGNPPYMSPEQIKAVNLDDRSDLYSLGCVLYQMFTGCPPHMGETAADVMMKHLMDPPIPLRQLRPDLDLPDSLELIVGTALQKDPEQRYPSMNALREELQSVRKAISDLSALT